MTFGRGEKLVAARGLEPRTYGLWDRRSNQLSYAATWEEFQSTKMHFASAKPAFFGGVIRTPSPGDSPYGIVEIPNLAALQVSPNRNPCNHPRSEHLNLIQSIGNTNCCGMVQSVVSAIFYNTFTNNEAHFQQSFPQFCGRRKWSDLSRYHVGVLADVLRRMPVRIPAWQAGRPLYRARRRRSSDSGTSASTTTRFSS